jgi:hypothetical protein
MIIKVDKDFPVPASARRKYPWDDMGIGDSFFVAGANSTGMSNAAKGARKKRTDSRWMCRTVVENGIEGVRVWRIA